jgi:hypothetical protein
VPYAPPGAIHPCHLHDGPRPHDAGHPCGMGSPVPPPTGAASSAIKLRSSLQGLKPGTPVRTARPYQYLSELRGVLPEQAPGAAHRACEAMGTSRAGIAPDPALQSRSRRAHPSTRRGLGRRLPPVYQTPARPRPFPRPILGTPDPLFTPPVARPPSLSSRPQPRRAPQATPLRAPPLPTPPRCYAWTPPRPRKGEGAGGEGPPRGPGLTSGPGLQYPRRTAMCSPAWRSSP